jgi:hypothetical protein
LLTFFSPASGMRSMAPSTSDFCNCHAKFGEQAPGNDSDRMTPAAAH